MNLFWEHGAMFVRELLSHYTPPLPHINTLSTIVRGLEEKKFIAHNSFGNNHQYYASCTKEEYRNLSLKGVINKYFENSTISAVSALVENEELSLEELRELITLIENKK